MLKAIMLLFLLALSWIGALWFIFPIDLNALSYPNLILLHASPPVVLFSVWFLHRMRQTHRQILAEAHQRSEEEAQRRATQAADQQQREAELRHLRFACNCRAAVVTGTGLPTSLLMSALPEDSADEEDTDNDSIFDDKGENSEPLALSADMQEFAKPLRQALVAIYRETPAALVLPVYVAPPTHLAATEVIALIHRFVLDIGESLDSELDSALDHETQVRFAPSGNGVTDRAIALFEQTPDLPGAVIVAFDAPIQRDRIEYAKAGSSQQRALVATTLDERAEWCGHPGMAVVALLLTHSDLAAMLASIRNCSPEGDAAEPSMTPFWNRATTKSAQLERLIRLPLDRREALGERTVLARIHRSAFSSHPSEDDTKSLGPKVQSLLEQASMASALLWSENGSAKKPAALGWVVHNAGTVGRYATRLGALASSIRQLGHDLHPLDAATNLANSISDFGAATAWVMLAEAIARTSESGKAVLAIDFQPEDGLAVSATMPIPSA